MHEGDTISLLVTVRSTVVAAATLSVARDGGKAASQAIRLHQGDNPFTLSYTAASVGWHAFRVGVRLAGDQRAAERRAHRERERRRAAARHRGVGVAQPADRRDPDAPAACARPSRRPPRFRATPRATRPSMPSCSTTCRPTCSAASQLSALSAAVRDGGLGLLTLGGRHAYSLGGYAHSALDRVLPVASLSPGDLQRRHLAVELVLDRSGSMADTAGGEGIPKMTMALGAARQTGGVRLGPRRRARHRRLRHRRRIRCCRCSA